MKNFIINLLPGFLVRLFARPYVGGDTIEKGIQKADDIYKENGFYSTMDLLGEEVKTIREVEKNVSIYLDLVQRVKDREYISISLKPTALGIHKGKSYCLETIERIVKAATDVGVLITLDMEEHDYTDATLDIYLELIKRYPDFGTVLQSRLYRTENDVKNLIKYSTRIRVCIGIYQEAKEIALTDKRLMKEKMLEYTKTLIEANSFVEFATHDQQTLEAALDMAKEYGWGPDKLEFQQLLGVPLQTYQKTLMEAGHIVRLYVPFATDWKNATPYLKRRLAANPKMAIYVLKHMFRRK